MKKSHSIALMAAGVLMSMTGLSACSSSSDVEEINPNLEYDAQGNAGVRPEFVISFPRSVVNSKTRMMRHRARVRWHNSGEWTISV